MMSKGVITVVRKAQQGIKAIQYDDKCTVKRSTESRL